MSEAEVKETSAASPGGTDEVLEITQETDVSFSDDTPETKSADTYRGAENTDRKRRKRKKRLIIGAIILGIIVLLIITSSIARMISSKKALKDMYTDSAVERRTITNTITGSSSIEPNDSYKVSSIHSGDITADFISEGKTVKKGDKLYQFDDEDARNQLTKAQQAYVDAVKAKTQSISSNNNSTKSAQNAVQRALNTLNDARTALNDRTVSSPISGKVLNVFVSEGDNVGNGANIAEIYNDGNMKIRLPFNEFDAAFVYEGADAEISVAGSGDTVWGKVTEVSSAATAANAHTMVIYATIELTNPGALSENDIGSAVVNGVACADTANFEYAQSRILTAKSAGTVETLHVSKGDGVLAGDAIAYIDSDSVETSYKNAQLSYDDAVLQLQRQTINNDTYSQDSQIKNAELSLKEARDAVADYLIEAPIAGTVVTKNAKAGDTINSSNANAEPLCVIYDLSSVKFSIDIDETEIALVKTGQKVTVTADAVDGEYEGEVIKVPVDGVNENGVTTYTIDVRIKDYGDLLPGMNVDAEIAVEEAQDALSVPMNSVNRGNIVFVKDDGIKRENDVTDIINGKKADLAGGGNAKTASKDGKESSMPPRGSMKPNDAMKPKGSIPPNNASKPQGSMQPRGSVPPKSESSNGRVSMDNIPMNIEIPEGYRAVVVETGINDSDYIEIISGLNEGDLVRTLNTNSSSAGASFGEGNAMVNMPGGGMGGNMHGGMNGGMGGANRSGGMSGGGMPR